MKLDRCEKPVGGIRWNGHGNNLSLLDQTGHLDYKVCVIRIQTDPDIS